MPRRKREHQDKSADYYSRGAKATVKTHSASESAAAADKGTKQRRECGGAAKVLMPMDGSAHTTARVRTSRRKYGCHGESVNSTAEVNVHQRKYIYRNKYRNKAAWVFRYHRYGDISASPKYGFSPPMRINSGPYSKGV